MFCIAIQLHSHYVSSSEEHFFLYAFVGSFVRYRFIRCRMLPKLLDTRRPSDATDSNRSPVIRGVEIPFLLLLLLFFLVLFFLPLLFLYSFLISLFFKSQQLRVTVGVRLDCLHRRLGRLLHLRKQLPIFSPFAQSSLPMLLYTSTLY